VKEKADLEKTEHEKAQWFCILLRKILAGLRRDMEESIAALGGGGGMHGLSHYRCHCLRHAGVVPNGGSGVAYHLH
jgi:hypothetical protein